MQKLAFILVAAALAGCAGAPKNSLDEELAGLTRLLEGDYFSAADGGAREGRPIYMRIRAIAPPEGRRHAMYSEMRHDGPDGEFYRQLIYLFDETPGRPENRMTALPVADKAAGGALVTDRGAFARGEIETKAPLSEDCYTAWRRDETAGPEAYIGRIDPARCVITGKRGDQRRIGATTRISKDAIEQLEQGFTLSGELLFGNADGERYVWPRVTPTE